MSVKAKDEWLEVKRKVNESVAVYRYRTEIIPPVNTSDFPTLVAITWEFGDYEDPFKFQRSVEEHHADLEQSLDHLNGEENGFLFLVRTGDELKEWVWYVKDFENWMVKLNEAFAGKPAFPIRIDPYEDPEWTTFKQVNEIDQ